MVNSTIIIFLILKYTIEIKINISVIRIQFIYIIFKDKIQLYFIIIKILNLKLRIFK